MSCTHSSPASVPLGIPHSNSSMHPPPTLPFWIQTIAGMKVHLEQGIRAFDAGNDFYFCDNYRAAYHDSHFAKNCLQILPFADSPGANGAAEIPNEVLIGAILKGFPTQTYHASLVKSWSIAARA